MTTTQEKIAIMQAYVDGKKIESLSYNNNDARWMDVTDPAWSWINNDYRVKKEKKTLWGAICTDNNYGAIRWFESEKELLGYYSLGKNYQVVSVEVEV